MGESKGMENLHLVTYDISAGKYTDHGPIFFEDGQRPYYVNSLAVGKDGSVYTLSRITENGQHANRPDQHPRPVHEVVRKRVKNVKGARGLP